MTRYRVIDVDTGRHSASLLNTSDRDWPETNCYVDVWIELLQTLGLEASACLPFTLATDFEDDQWMFFKPPLADLEALYGIRVEELTLWRSLAAHCVAQVAAGKLPLVEVDAFYLPDTRATDYRTNHTKTSIAINAIAPESGELGYFHNRGYHQLDGDDFDGLFRLEAPPLAGYLPPYCEILKIDRLHRLDDRELRARSLELVRHHLGRAPARNPIDRFRDGIDEHLAWVLERDLEAYHAYVFASVRQCGAAFECAETLMHWLGNAADPAWARVAEHFGTISRTSKTLVMKLARIVNSGQMRDLSGHFDAMAAAWTDAYGGLHDLVRA
ncbi:MAG: DUF1839 family protein [Pseudomonadales bacterium]